MCLLSTLITSCSVFLLMGGSPKDVAAMDRRQRAYRTRTCHDDNCDGGYGFDPARIRLTGRIVIVVTVLATVAFAYAAIF